jgi:hypothetical protein
MAATISCCSVVSSETAIRLGRAPRRWP